MQIADAVEEIPFVREVYIGIENFHVTAVNPTMQELVEMGIPATEEPYYTGTMMRDLGEGEKEYKYFSIRVFLDNKDPDTPIKTQVQYTVLDGFKLSSTGKYQVLNKYGTGTWLEESHLTSGTVPDNMQWYVNEDVKKARNGEEGLVEFIKALRNLVNINKTSTQEQKDKGLALFSENDLSKMFAGDFTDIRNVLLTSNELLKVGFLLGARVEEGNTRQNLYSRLPLKTYMKHSKATDYLAKQVKDSQDNGSFSTTFFDLSDMTLRKYDPSANAIQEVPWENTLSFDISKDNNKESEELTNDLFS